MFVSLYVDDLIFMGNNVELIKEFKRVMKKEFDKMTELGLMKYFLGLEVVQGEEDIFVCHEIYVEKVLKKFKMSSCNLVSNQMELGTKFSKYGEGDRVNAGKYQSLIGTLHYLINT